MHQILVRELRGSVAHDQNRLSPHIKGHASLLTRPRTMALDFSSALDGAFNLGGELGELHQTVEQK